MSEEEGAVPEESGYYAPLQWRWSNWDIIGIGAAAVGGIFTVLGQGCTLLSRECAAMAQWKRAEHDRLQGLAEEEYKRLTMAETYERLVGLDELWLEQEEQEKP